MKTKLILMFLIVFLSNIYPQKINNSARFKSTEIDTLTLAKTMFDDQNFVMAYPYLNKLQKDYPSDGFLKYLTGICCLFKEDTHKQGLDFLLEVYAHNKRAEDIEFYIALAYNYNNNFEEAITMVDKYLSGKHLTNPQIREAQKLKEYCGQGEILIIAHDEGKLEDYSELMANEDEK